MTIQKGQVLNPNGARKSRVWQSAIERALERNSVGKIDFKAIDECAEALIAACKSGDIGALKEMGDRLDGKASQDLNLTVTEKPQARVYPTGLPLNDQSELPAPSEAVDSVH